MNKKKKLKGFTLIELIIVLAIFSIILTLVMSFIDPVAKIMSRTSIKERTAAYVDNIGEYVEKSIHYAKYIRVFEGDYCDTANENTPITVGTGESLDEKMAKNFVDYYLDGVVDADGELIKGKVHILKFMNEDEILDDGGIGLQKGRIYESIYNFQAGATYDKEVPDPLDPSVMITEKATFADCKLPLPGSTSVVNREVINEEHFVDYNYYYNIGFYNFNPITDQAEKCPSLTKERGAYYSRLVEMKDNSGNNLQVDKTSGRNFTLNVIAYKNDKDDSGNELYRYDGTEYKIDDDNSEYITAFKSPCHMNTTSMALLNAIKANETNYISNYKIKRKATDGSADKTDSGDLQFIAIEKVDEGLPFSILSPPAPSTDNIYIVYILPDEIEDSQLTYK